MTTIAPGGALHEGPARPRAPLPGFGQQPPQGPARAPALLPGLGFLRPVVRPVRPVLAPVLRAALPAHLRARPLLPPAAHRRPAEVPAPRRPPTLLLAAVAGAAAVTGLAVLAVVAWPLGAAGPAPGPARVPAAAVAVAGGTRLLDATGTDLGVVAAAPAGVPQVVAGAEPGTVASRVDSAAVAAAVAVRAELPPALAREVVAVGATSRDRVWLALGDGARVEWGSSERPGDKAEALAGLRAGAPHARGYDVSAPDAPASTAR